MEVFLILGLLIGAVWLLAEHGNLNRLRLSFSDLQAKLDGWSKWLYGFYSEVQSLRQQVESLNRRIAELERATQSPVVAPPNIAPDVGAPDLVAPPVAAANAATPIIEPSLAVPAPIAPPIESVPDAPPPTAPLVEPATVAPPLVEPATVAPMHPELPLLEPTETDSTQVDTPEFDPEDVAAATKPKFDWESLIGVRLFSWVAGLSLLLGAVFFLRYSADNGWLSPTVRMAMGFLTGIVLLGLCEWRGQRYRVTANAMDAAGIGTLFATSFAGNAVWHLIPTMVSFLLLVLVTAVAVLLSIRRASMFIALLGLVGGFATPILLSTGENRPFGLFGYLLLLNAGLGFVSYRQRWPILLSLSIALTTLYQWGWVTKFVMGDSGQVPVAVGVFLVFPLLWIGAHQIWQRRQRDALPPWVSDLLSFSSVLPLLFGLAMAWIPAFGERYLLLYGYLFVLDVGLLLLDYQRPKDRLGTFAAVGTWFVWLGWSLRNYSSDAWPSIVFVLAAFVLLFLVADWLGSHAGAPAKPARFAAPALLLTCAVLAVVEPAAANPWLLFGTLFALLVAICATAIRHRDGWLYYAAAPSAMLAEAAWSAEHLTLARLTAGLIIYLAFALVFVFTPILARHYKRPFTTTGMVPVIAPIHISLLMFMASGEVANRSLWMIGLVMILLNLGAFVEARSSRRYRAAFVGLGLSWCVILLWWSNAMRPEHLVPGLVVVLALVLLSVGGILWIRDGRSDGAPDNLLEQGPLLGLIGHLFLLFVAAQPTLNRPPWPLFAILLALDLALVVASLHLKRALFASAGLALSWLVLGVWAIAVNGGFATLHATEVTLAMAVVLIGYGVALPALAKRVKVATQTFLWGRELNTLLAQCLFVELAALRHPPHLVAMLAAQLLAMALLMRAAIIRRSHWLVLASWGANCAAQAAWGSTHFTAQRWGHLLALGLLPYAMMSSYPILCRMVGTGMHSADTAPSGEVFQGIASQDAVRRWPFAVAICGALGFFASGYVALRASPYAGFMGALPVAEALVMAALLVFLLRVVEPTAPRDTGRLALVSAVALGFATTAIPLQLEKEWLTIAWALEATVLGWLYQRLRHSGLIAASLALSAAVTVRLTLNPEVFLYHARSATPIFNYYLYAYLTCAAAIYVASWYLRDAKERRFAWLNRTTFVERAFATLLLFILLNIEIADYHSVGRSIQFRFSSTLAQDLSYTLGWAAFAIGMLTVGILIQGRAARIAALVLLTITIAKCFLHDLWRLGGLYRVGSFVGLALCLAFVAILLQRFVLHTHRTEGKS